MPLLETLRSSLFGGRDGPAVYRCRSCYASFSEPRGLDPSEVECSFCGSADVRAQA